VLSGITVLRHGGMKMTCWRWQPGWRRGSEHPLAEAIMSALLKSAALKPAKVTGFEAVTGKGVMAKAGSKAWHSAMRR
jgi:cation transport ATPase